MSQQKTVVKIAPNNPIFDLPVIVGIEEKLFEQAGLDVQFAGTYEDREKKDKVEFPVMARLKEQMFDCGSADSYNVCEWASIDRLEKGKRGGDIAALRASVAAQAIITFDDTLQVPRDLTDEQRKAYYDAENCAVDLINADFYKYAHHVAAATKGALQPNELLKAFVRYKHVDYYDQTTFGRAYDWMKDRGLTEGQSQHSTFVAN